jgi:hypothetical protein
MGKLSVGYMFQISTFSQAWWCMPATPAPGRWRQEDFEFEPSLVYVVRLS